MSLRWPGIHVPLVVDALHPADLRSIEFLLGQVLVPRDQLADHRTLDPGLLDELDPLLIASEADQIRLDGQVEESVFFVHEDTAATCEVNVSHSFSASNVVLDFSADGCPLSGDIQATAVVSADCTGQNFTLNVDGTWSTRAVYDGVTETVTFSDGTNVWTVENDCNGGPAASLRW